MEDYLCIDKSPRLLVSKLGLERILSKVMQRQYDMPWDKEVKYMDVRKLPFATDSISNIYSSHLLEHLHLFEAKLLLNDCFRMLRPGGILRLALPDYHEFILNYVSNSARDPVGAFFEFESSLLSWPLEKQKVLERLSSRLFGKLHVHKWHPTKFIVKEFLIATGFTRVTEYSFREGSVPNLHLLENRDSGTFYLEASKPITF